MKAQINTDRVLSIGKNALYYEDYVVAIQYFNQVIKAKPHLAEPYLYRGLAKFYLDDYSGAERDLTSCIEQNPFLWMAYQIRGASRQSQGNFKGAIEDYNKGIEFRPEDRHFLFNKGIALAQLKEYDEAIKLFDELIQLQSGFVPAYLTRGAVYIEKKDTLNALENYNRALEIDKYYAPAYERRAILFLQQEEYQKALQDIDEAIRLESKQPGYYINRGLIRYYLNDLRGAMNDYDNVILIDKNNLIARFNRALLKSTVGDMNGAREDFNIVINSEPDNYIAIYNRAILNMELNSYPQALEDINLVIKEYPNFVQGYYFRSEIKKKMNDLRGAEKDYWEAHDLEEKLNRLKKQGKIITGKEILDAEPDENGGNNKVRESSDSDIEKFNRLVIYDKEEESKSQYQNEIRGRVQDRQVKVDMEYQFLFTYYESLEEIDRTSTRSDKLLESLNKNTFLKKKLRITNNEVALTDEQAEFHFKSIDDYSLLLNKYPGNSYIYFMRGIDYMILQDFGEAIDDFTEAIKFDPTFSPAYFNRAIARYKQIEIENASMGEAKALDIDLNVKSTSTTQNLNQPFKPEIDKTAYQYSFVLQDYNQVIELNPDFSFAYFNRATVKFIQKDYRGSIADYNEAIKVNPEFAEAYFNRGLTRLYIGETTRGIEDLSKAGELGIVDAYS
ncbi:tetratricopeptide repeat protein, partial [Bacteroidales bacterium OttesenSCG-928-M11]|nr:tetratricopeptide repeat protein [Bacteroidales bacterium OttesenSCG-928-M11]